MESVLTSLANRGGGHIPSSHTKLAHCDGETQNP